MFLAVFVAAATLRAATGPFDGKQFQGRIAYSADGNHNDEDDWAASPLALAIFAEFGVKDKLVHFDYNSILHATNPEWQKAHETSILGAAERYGYRRSLFRDCRRDLSGVIASLRRAINESSAENPLYFIVAGPMQVAWEAIRSSNPARREFVYVISHSRWNDGFDTRTTFVKTKRDVIRLGVNWVQIRDQNEFLSTSPYGRPANDDEWRPWHWMRDSKDGRLGFLWDRMRATTRADASDSGMAYFLLTGDEQPAMPKVVHLLEAHGRPQPIHERNIIRLEAENFRVLDNYEVEYRNERAVSHRINLKATGTKGRIATRFRQPYTAPHAVYDVGVRYNGSARFVLAVNGVDGVWSAVSGDGEWKTHTIQDVPIRDGDEISLHVEGEVRLDYIQLNRKTIYYPPAEASGGWRSLVAANIEPSAAEKARIRSEAGLDWDRLAEAWRYATGFGGPNSILVVRHGWIAAEWRTFSEPRGIASCTKSLTGLTMAKLFDAMPGRIGLDDPVFRFMPVEWAAAEPRRKQILVRHLLTMTSGQDPYDGPYQDLAAYAKTVLSVGVEAAPGTVWAYASAPVDQLSHVIESAAGSKQGDYFRREIALPIGMAPFEWPEFDGHTGGSGGVRGGARLTPREIARVGYLLLHRGVWDDGAGPRQIISVDRVKALSNWARWLEKAAYREPNFAREKGAQQVYSPYLFWTNRTQEPLGSSVPADTFYMAGYGKQGCWIIPSLDMVVVRLGSHRPLNDRPEFFAELLSRIVAATEPP
jgi:CubicO group peptidase (beta-lactamase class C family)